MPDRTSFRQVDHERTTHVTAVHPLAGTRPVLMLADYQPPGPGRAESWDVYPAPVLGVQTVTVEKWFIVVGGRQPDPPFPGTPAAARRAGWQRDGEHARVRYLVQVDGEIAPQCVMDFERSVNTACRAFLATWPEAEDRKRLHDQLGELKSWAKQRWLDSRAGPGDGGSREDRDGHGDRDGDDGDRDDGDRDRDGDGDGGGRRRPDR